MFGTKLDTESIGRNFLILTLTVTSDSVKYDVSMTSSLILRRYKTKIACMKILIQLNVDAFQAFIRNWGKPLQTKSMSVNITIMKCDRGILDQERILF